ncbi:MAG: hypothetical protein ACFFBP_00990 [Promethearchaeota archaeon]
MKYQINYNNNNSQQIQQALKVLASWIGEPDLDSTNSFNYFTLENNQEEIKKLNLEETNKLKKIDDFLILSLDDNNKNEITFISMGDRGLANSIYYLYMKLKERQIHDPFSINWNVFETPYFETRGICLFNLPFGLEGLCTDTWTLSAWKVYLNRLRSFNYTSVIFGLHGGMLYHPDYEELIKNSWRYEIYEEVFKYAEEIGLEIIIMHVLNVLPVELWIKHPEIRGTIEIEQGITYCTQKGKEFGENLIKYTLERFKNVPGAALFAFEGGGCNCDYDRNNMVDIVDNFLKFIRKHANPKKLYFCTWFAYVKENFYSPSIKGLRKNLFAQISKDIKIFDVSRKTLKMAKNQDFEILDFLFFMDPEDGCENSLIFPRPLIKMTKDRIFDSIQDLSPNLKGIFGYRVIPKTRFINDYIFGRYLWDPEIELKNLISETAGLLSCSNEEKEGIMYVIQQIEDFWKTLDGDKIKESNKILKSIIQDQKEPLEPLKSIQEALAILDLLLQYYSTDSERKKGTIFQKIYKNMRIMDTFQCYTSYKVWDIVSREVIKQRIKWWTDHSRGLFDPQAFPWNCIWAGKYHLFENKKDVLPWFEMKDLVKIGVQRITSKLKRK